MSTRVSINAEAVQKLASEATNPALARLLDDHAAAMARTAQRLVPVDTGKLHDSIHVESSTTDHREIVADTEYAAYVELGTMTTPAQPYLRPALDERLA